MSTLLPLGYVTFEQAITQLDTAISSGVPDEDAVKRIRKTAGLDVGDERARKAAVAELWKSVDGGHLRAMAIGGRRRKVVRLDQGATRDTPLLRRVGGFAYLRPSSRIHKQFVAWFGSELSDVTLAFRQTDVDKSANRILRGRRRACVWTDGKAGRPSSYSSIAPIIESLINNKKWNTTQSIKKLTRLVHRDLKVLKVFSEDTIGRVLDRLYLERKDRSFQRRRRGTPV